MRFTIVVTILLLFLCDSVISQEKIPLRLTKRKGNQLNAHEASIVCADKSLAVTCDETFVHFLIAIAREAGNHEQWKEQNADLSFTNFVTFSTNAFGPYKCHLGSHGFSGLRSISVEIDLPYRVKLVDAGKIYLSNLPEDSNMVLAIIVLWQTSSQFAK